MDDALLIILVERYEELYNLKHPHYSNVQRRDNIWEEIGSTMKQEGGSCRERWARIRDNYRKALNLRKTKSGQAASKIKPPKFNKELRFLVPFLSDEENRRSNISGSETEDDNTLSSMRSNILNLDGASPSTPITQSYTPVCSPDIYTQSTNSDCSTSRGKTSFRNRSSNNETAASVLKQYLLSRERQQTTARSTACQNGDLDPLTDFFLTMAKTVKTFPIQEQVNIKAEIFKTLNKVEMKLATTTNLNVVSEPPYAIHLPSDANTQPRTSQNITAIPDSRKILITCDIYLSKIVNTSTIASTSTRTSPQMEIHAVEPTLHTNLNMFAESSLAHEETYDKTTEPHLDATEFSNFIKLKK